MSLPTQIGDKLAFHEETVGTAPKALMDAAERIEACVSVLELTDAPEIVGTAVGAALGTAAAVSALDATYLVTADTTPQALQAAIAAAYPDALIAGFGNDLAVLKGVGDPRTLADAWGLATAQGWQGVGHTRMATESARRWRIPRLHGSLCSSG